MAEATGRHACCGSAPTNAIEYRVGARVTGDDASIADRKAAVATLNSQGWAVTDEQYTDDPYPYARLECGLRLSLDPDARRGSDAMTFGLAGDRIRTDKGQDDESSGTEEIDVPQLGPNGPCHRAQRTVVGRQANRAPHRHVGAGQRCTTRVPIMSGWIVQPNG